MPNKRATGSRSTVIRCPNCGEDYSVTYKRRPFCEEKASAKKRERYEDDGGDFEIEYEGDEESTSRRSGGKRLAGGSPRRGQGGGSWTPLRLAGTVISLAIIAAAIWIVATQIVPLVKRSEIDPDATPTPPVTQSEGPSQDPDATDAPDDTTPPSLTPEPEATPTVPVGQTATGFTLNKSDFTMNDQYPDPVQLTVTFTPAGTTGEITWTSSNPDVATVDATGLVRPGSKTGSATITAAMAGGYQQECTVRNSVTSASSSGSASSASLSLNKTDFTFGSLSEPAVQMKVSGTSSTPVWSIGNTSVATITEGGLVKPVGRGTTTITCKVDGQTLECIVRCTF